MTSEHQQAWWDAARTQWPQIEVPRDEFIAFVEHALERAKDLAPDTIDAGECLVAYACVRGDARALRAFELRYTPAIRAGVRGIVDCEGVAEEVRQRLWERLFVGAHGRPPRIADYAGRGRLAGLVALAARREGTRIARQRERHASSSSEAASQAAGLCAGSPVRSAFARDLQGALADAWVELEPREATLLRLRYVEGLTPTTIARAYRTHRTTVSRWIAHAERRLGDATRRRLRTAHGLSGDTLESLIRDVRGDLSVSLRDLLTPPTGARSASAT